MQSPPSPRPSPAVRSLAKVSLPTFFLRSQLTHGDGRNKVVVLRQVEGQRSCKLHMEEIFPFTFGGLGSGRGRGVCRFADSALGAGRHLRVALSGAVGDLRATPTSVGEERRRECGEGGDGDDGRHPRSALLRRLPLPQGAPTGLGREVRAWHDWQRGLEAFICTTVAMNLARGVSHERTD